MWIFQKMRFWKCAFCQNWDFDNLNFWIKSEFFPSVKWDLFEYFQPLSFGCGVIGILIQLWNRFWWMMIRPVFRSFWMGHPTSHHETRPYRDSNPHVWCTDIPNNSSSASSSVTIKHQKGPTWKNASCYHRKIINQKPTLKRFSLRPKAHFHVIWGYNNENG